jgi:hypothetical protein
MLPRIIYASSRKDLGCQGNSRNLAGFGSAAPQHRPARRVGTTPRQQHSPTRAAGRPAARAAKKAPQATKILWQLIRSQSMAGAGVGCSRHAGMLGAGPQGKQGCPRKPHVSPGALLNQGAQSECRQRVPVPPRACCLQEAGQFNTAKGRVRQPGNSAGRARHTLRLLQHPGMRLPPSQCDNVTTCPQPRLSLRALLVGCSHCASRPASRNPTVGQASSAWASRQAAAPQTTSAPLGDPDEAISRAARQRICHCRSRCCLRCAPRWVRYQLGQPSVQSSNKL